MSQRTLIVSILRDGSISGMAMRFVALWSYLSKHRPEREVWLFSNDSLLNRLSISRGRATRVVSFEDRGRAYLLRRVWSALLFLWAVVFHRIQTVHLVAGGVDFMPLLPVLKLLRVKVCITFAIAGVDVGLHGEHKRRVESALRRAPNVEFLNPNPRVPYSPHKRFYSPCSFPYILALGKTVVPAPAEQRKNWIVFSGTFAAHKGPDLAVEGFGLFLREFSSQHPDLELRMFGGGPLEATLRSRAKELNAEAGREAIRFEKQETLFEQLAVARMFLSLQEHENYPSQALMEAMLYENPVVATDVGDTRLIVPEAGNALVEPTGSAVKAGILRLLAGPRSVPGNAEFIREQHSPARFADYFLDVHSQLD